jgi:tetratricopeptide (TPR) repeat protein
MSLAILTSRYAPVSNRTIAPWPGLRALSKGGPAPQFSLKGVFRGRFLGFALGGAAVVGSALHAWGQSDSGPGSERERLHQTEQWRAVQAHLPDRATATPQILEQEADILRARRFPADALDFYNAAIARGGSPAGLLNKLGLTELEMHNVELARAYFKRAVKLNPRDPNSWNNLGAVEYVDRGVGPAISDYRHAIKLDKKQAVFHANLATAYFEQQDFNGARKEMTVALKLDPGIFNKDVGTGGVEAHVLTSKDRARFAYEMAKIYAHDGNEDQMMHSLAMAAEAGMDVRGEMMHDAALLKFANDPRVLVLVHNAQVAVAAKRTGNAAVSGNLGSGAVPAPVAE